MWRRLVPSTCLLMLLTFQVPTLAQETAGGLIPERDARRFGLTRAWSAQAAVNRARGRILHLELNVSSTRAHAMHQITSDQGQLRISERDADRDGNPLGKDGAQQLAEETVAQLQQQQLNPQLETLVIPEITLYLTTDRALLQSLEGESGRTHWITMVGKREYPTTGVAVNEKYLAVINGSTLYVLDRNDGKTIWHRQTLGVPGSSPAISPDMVFVPGVGGALEAFLIDDYRKTPALYRFSGRALIRPAVSARSVAWTTDQGRMYVADSRRQGLRFRLETNNTITAPAVFLEPNRLLIASVDGDLYCIHEMSGNVVWRFTTGQPISHTPVIIGDSVYLNTDDGELFCVDPETGDERWRIQRVHQFVAASKDRLYCLGDAGQLLILSAQNGRRIGDLPTLWDDMLFTNSLTDRIYVAKPTGLVQCFHEMDQEWPLLHVGLAEEEPTDEDAAAEQAPVAPVEQRPAAGAEDAGPADPFGAPGGGDPFGAEPAGGDPFGPPAKGGGGDPFSGGAEDPFK